MEICCVSDLHSYFPDVGSGDLLIICGDLTARDTNKNWVDFEIWITSQSYKSIIIIAGNHDNFLASTDEHRMWKFWDKADYRIHYLCDSGTEFEGLKIWGSPWSLWFDGINPKCAAFTGFENDLKKKFDLIPNDIDILITHSPMYGILDQNIRGKSCGSIELRNAVDRVKPRFLIHGHIHEQGGQQLMYKHAGPNTWCVNASIMNEKYEPVNNPIRIEL